jgi:hypothetical protein
MELEDKKIVVTNEESELFQNMEAIFDEVLQGKPYSLFVAGGWVRDKVIHREDEK